ncbi:NHL repeat-containing protein [Parelusimicrobium proximum]|uniref:NHL domain-containing protein n=1 Tax=Parelusimicrobium proximum TaxID=3228953 RepID=UPI003D162F94
MYKSFRSVLSVVLALLIMFPAPSYAALAKGGLSDIKRFSLKTEIDLDEQAKELPAEKVKKVEAFRNKAGKDTQIRLSSNGVPRALFKTKGLRARGRGANQAISLLKNYEDFLQVDTKNLKTVFSKTSPIGTHNYFRQYYKGLPVENAYVKVHFNKSGELMYYQSTYQPDLDVNINPSISMEAAAAIAASDALTIVPQKVKADLTLLAASGKDTVLTWRTDAGDYVYFVNAHTGTVELRYSKKAYYALKSDLSYTYPGDGLGTNTVSLNYFSAYYYNAVGDTNPTKFTLSSGGAFTIPAITTPAQRVFAHLSGPYFNVVNGKMAASNLSAMYIQPDDPASSANGDLGLAYINGMFNAPSDITTDSSGNYLIVDSGNNVIRKIDKTTNIITTIAGGGSSTADGISATTAKLTNPRGIAVKSTGDIYITENNKVRKISGGIITTVAGTGTSGNNGDNASALLAQLKNPTALAFDSTGNLYVADTGNNRIRMIVEGGNITHYAGSPTGVAGNAVGDRTTQALFAAPRGIAINTGNDTVYVSDTNNHNIKRISAATVDVIAGSSVGLGGNNGDTGPAINTLLSYPSGIKYRSGAVYFADMGNHKAKLASPGGNIYLIAGSGTAGYSGDNGPSSSAQLNTPVGIYVDVDQALIVDQGNNRIRRNYSGTLTTFAGGGAGSYAGSPNQFTESTPATAIESAHPYLENNTDVKSTNRYFTTCNNAYKNRPFFRPAFVAAEFATDNVLNNNFAVGKISDSGAITLKDYLAVYADPSSANPRPAYAKYVGSSISRFFGPIMTSVSGASMFFELVAGAGNAVAALYGYKVDKLTAFCIPPVMAGNVYQYGDLKWNSPLPEINAFYQLNTMREYFQGANLNNSNAYVDLDSYTMPVMVNTSPSTTVTMANAFYDSDLKAIYIGEGIDGRNFALENAIVRHEYVHYVTEQIWPLMYYGEGAAISEAVADFFALSSLRRPDKTAYTTQIGVYVNTGAGEGKARDLSGHSVYDSNTWASSEAHDNSLVISRAVWRLREATDLGVAALGIDETDKLLWYTLMFFPDTLLEFRESMITAAGALGYSTAAVEKVFDDANVVSVSASGDVYEPNNGPMTAYGLSSVNRKITANLNPADDVDYYAFNVPAQSNVTITLMQPQVPNTSAAPRYFPLGMVLLNDAFSVVEDNVVSPIDSYGVTLQNKNTLTFVSPAVTPYTGRYIVGIYKPDTARASNLNYTLEITTDKDAALITAVQDPMDKTKIEVTAPYVALPGHIAIPTELQSSGLTNWETGEADIDYYVRILGDRKQELPTATTHPSVPSGTQSITYTSNGPDSATKTVSGTIVLTPQFFADYPYESKIYVEYFGMSRNGANDNNNTPVVQGFSYGLSDPIALAAAGVGNQTVMFDNIFSPNKGQQAKLYLYSPNSGNVTAKVYTITGVLVKELYDGPIIGGDPAIAVYWNGENDKGTQISSGTYILMVKGAGLNHKQKIAVVR